MKALIGLLLGVCALVLIAGCGSGGGGSADASAQSGGTTESPGNAPGPDVTVPSGPPPRRLVVRDLKRGDGRPAKKGDEVKIEYVGVNWEGQSYSNSWVYSTGAPSFNLGQGQLIRGFERGILGMKAGGRRQLLVPIGLTNVPGVRVSPRAKPLVFIVDMLEVRKENRSG